MRNYLRAANVGWSGLLLDDVKQMNFTDDEMKTFRLEPGDLLLNEASGSAKEVGKPALWNGEIEDCAFQNTLLRVRPLPETDPRYLLHYFSYQAATGAFARGSRGVGINHLGREALSKWPVPLPPLDEQRRIAAILDHSDSLRHQRSQVQSDLDELIESAFQQMFDKSLHDWPIVSLGDLITLGPQNGLYRPAHQYGSGVPIVRIDSFQSGSPIEIANLKRVQLSESDAVPYILKDGDVIVNRVNARTHLGKATMVTGLAETTVFESNIMRLRLDVQKVTPEYVDAALRTPQVKRQIQTAAKDAVNQSSINQQDVINLKTCLPPLELQHRYIRLRKEIHEQQTACRRSLIAIDQLFVSLQSRAFRGEL